MNANLKTTGCLLILSLAIFGQAAAQITVSEKPLTPNIPEGFVLIHGDILVPEGYTEGTFSVNLWPDGIVHYEFNSNVTQTNQDSMLNAMAEWEAVANVSFVERTAETNYVHIQNSIGNNSAVGMQGGQQIINIVSWGTRFIMAHELGHTLGLWHEQSRSDRDGYVDISYDNIQAGREGNFDIVSSSIGYPKPGYGLADSLTYDFDSVMHYGQFAFCINPCPGPTIEVLSPNDDEWQDRIGQRDHLSFLDQLTMSFLYPEAGWYFVDQTYSGTENGSFLEPYEEFSIGMSSAPDGSTLWIQPGTYDESGTLSDARTIRAPLGNVTIGNNAASSAIARAPDEPDAQLPHADEASSQVQTQRAGSSLEVAIPAKYALARNYPNPFNPITTIKYALPEEAHVSLKIYNMLGQEVRNLVGERRSAAFHSVVWDGRDNAGHEVASGTYIYRLSASDPSTGSSRGFVKTLLMTLVR